MLGIAPVEQELFRKAGHKGQDQQQNGLHVHPRQKQQHGGKAGDQVAVEPLAPAKAFPGVQYMLRQAEQCRNGVGCGDFPALQRQKADHNQKDHRKYIEDPRVTPKRRHPHCRHPQLRPGRLFWLLPAFLPDGMCRPHGCLNGLFPDGVRPCFGHFVSLFPEDVRRLLRPDHALRYTLYEVQLVLFLRREMLSHTVSPYNVFGRIFTS